jgi:hypothetical protein
MRLLHLGAFIIIGKSKLVMHCRTDNMSLGKVLIIWSQPTPTSFSFFQEDFNNGERVIELVTT